MCVWLDLEKSCLFLASANSVVAFLFPEFLQITFRNGTSLTMARSQNAKWMMRRCRLSLLCEIIFW